MTPIERLSREEVRSVDQRTIEEFGLPGIALMENAGRGVFELLVSLKARGPIKICAGKGNNGGDGFVIARHLDNAGIPVELFLLADPEQLTGDAATNYQVASRMGISIQADPDLQDPEGFCAFLASAEWIVDALLGTGVQGSIREPFATAIRLINEASANKLAIDLPSGLDCDTGQPLGDCVIASQTATFVAEKKGFAAPESRDFTGTVHVLGIGAPRQIITELLQNQ
ncbi:NAD(P)H-hydrate epimerase [Gimesia panareensis]|uniref:NAD(P)H-hydrate epimerase n=1 Tax=Gimesia panareensis TaxID=2527978 RepID=A0A517QGJ9_9PLAN|nr:NAD(P)H-hydrate epimerase [Gimesia panareensis]QDT30725.1 Bifunctional NAD(P)H-hydrate repair enzyme Nnr [Gimesia panareensis]QDU53774.1 Bifunctional NAD(P)H-hydrate repair enzyme Nnr [Gimesia panareensis]QDV21674.1 Bifunctional NAD(P)H-hydrate repair enzyme Nnr [Gimesia panareensis]